MNASEHDQDSMMALEALLKIKSHNNSVIPSHAAPAPSTAPTTPVTIVPNTTILNLAHHFIPMHIVSAQSPFAPLLLKFKISERIIYRLTWFGNFYQERNRYPTSATPMMVAKDFRVV